ncbi:MAG: hypothetical protein QFB86_04235 [Patescibacteria group bacterium]|nr:hypothetical protein [Patescibacteria group bacterium]
MWQKLKKVHETLPGYAFFGLLELAISYGFISLAIDKGSGWWYLFTLIFLYGALENLFGFIQLSIKKVKRG